MEQVIDKRESWSREEMLSRMQAEKDWDKQHWFLASFKHAYYFIGYRCPFLLGNACRRAKWGFQRMFRGYDDTAYWDLNDYITDIALPVLKEYRNSKTGIPLLDGYGMDNRNQTDQEFKQMEETWNMYLDKMILSFELMKKEDMDYEHHDQQWYEEHNKKIEEGLILFAKYFRGLWD